MYSGNWQQDTLSAMSSDNKDAFFAVKFKGTQIGFYGLARRSGGYAHIVLRDKKGKTIVSSIVDMYCRYSTETLKFLSPALKKDNYTLTVTVMGEHGNWWDKRKNLFGSTGNFVSLDKIVVND